MTRIISVFLFLFLFSVTIQGHSEEQSSLLKADSTTGETRSSKSEEAEKFNAGKMILEHVVDNHEWHIAEIGSVDVVIPLPVILLYKGSWYCFSSQRFHNETHSHQGFLLKQEDPGKGKIIALDSTGKPDQMAKVYDFSITKTVLSIFISAALLVLIFVSVANRYKKSRNQAPKGIQSLLEPLIIFVRDDIARSSIGEKKYEKYVPFLLTIFFFIFFNNLFGLIPLFPGGVNVTGNIAVTLVLAVFTFLITTFSGNKHYWIDVINTPGVPWWLKFPIPLMPIVEIIGLITKPFVLMIRLFANIAAGHIIALGFVSLIFIFGSISVALGLGVSVVSVTFMIFMNLLELLVAFIQAYVFTLLSALYFGLATVEPEHH